MSGLGGILVPLVTPFGESGAVDRESLRALAGFLLREGADALVLTALTGEGPLLSEEETVVVWETVFEAAAGRRPVFPAIQSFTTERAVRLARRAHALGAEAILLTPIVPELYAGRSERDVVRFFEEVAGATALSIILFNYPLVDALERTSNPTGTIKAGLRARGVDVGVPRAPGQDLLPEEHRELEATLASVFG